MCLVNLSLLIMVLEIITAEHKTCTELVLLYVEIY